MQIIQINRHENTNHTLGQIHKKDREINLIHFLAAEKLMVTVDIAEHECILAFSALMGNMGSNLPNRAFPAKITKRYVQYL